MNKKTDGAHSTESTNFDEPLQKRGVKAIRNEVIAGKAMAGQTATKIAADLNISRATVSKVLNSDEITEKIKSIEGQLASGIDDAVSTMLDAVKYDFQAAKCLLQNFGYMQKKLINNEAHTSLEDLVLRSYRSDLDEK